MGIPTRPLLALSAAVLLAHLAALHWLPAGLPDAPAADRPAPFEVRMVLPPPPPRPAPPPPKPRPRPAPKPVPAKSEEKVPQAQDLPGPDAIDPIASAVIGPSMAPAAAAPAEPEPPAGTAEPPAPPAPAPPPVGLPAPAHLFYDAEGFAKGFNWHAKSELRWQQDGQNYQLWTEVSAFLIGSRSQTSTGRIGPLGLQPLRFGDKPRRSEQAAHFDYEQGRVVFSSNAPEVALAPGAQDRLSVFLQLGALLAGDPARYPEGAAISVQTVGTRDAENWLFTVAHHEELALPVGALATVRLDRAPRKDYDTRVEVWYAPALGFLPVRIRITQQNGDYVDQKLRSMGNIP